MKYESKINPVEMRSMRSKMGVTLMDNVKNCVKECCTETDYVESSTKIEKRMINWCRQIS